MIKIGAGDCDREGGLPLAYRVNKPYIHASATTDARNFRVMMPHTYEGGKNLTFRRACQIAGEIMKAKGESKSCANSR